MVRSCSGRFAPPAIVSAAGGCVGAADAQAAWAARILTGALAAISLPANAYWSAKVVTIASSCSM